jgi:hypothetical protein
MISKVLAMGTPWLYGYIVEGGHIDGRTSEIESVVVAIIRE